MRILFLSHYYPPEVNAPANRLPEHARVWVADGHEVTVLTGVPNHPHGELFPGYENRWLQEERIDGVRVVRTWMYLTANAGFARRIANYLAFLVTAVVASFRLARPDVVVATSPQFFCGVAGALVALLKRRPFVLEVRDLWPDSIVQLGQLESRPAIRVLEAVERWLYAPGRARGRAHPRLRPPRGGLRRRARAHPAGHERHRPRGLRAAAARSGAPETTRARGPLHGGVRGNARSGARGWFRCSRLPRSCASACPTSRWSSSGTAPTASASPRRRRAAGSRT